MLLKIIVAVGLIAFASSQGLPDAPVPCDGQCPDITYQHYFAKGCEPVFDDSVSECCPASFNCTIIEKDPKLCYYKGKTYKDREEVPIANPCEASCFCDVQTLSGTASVTCAQVECPSLFNPSLFRCEQRQTIDQCCPEILSCPEEGETEPPVTESLAITRTAVTCEVEGKVFSEGDKIYPTLTPCQYCICNENFTDVYGDGCRTLECGMEYRDRQELEKGCTPIYFRNRCCHIDWVCPGSDKIKDTEQVPTGEESPETHCKLGSVVAPVNSTLATTDDVLFCYCTTPPDFTCIQFPDATEAQKARSDFNSDCHPFEACTHEQV